MVCVFVFFHSLLFIRTKMDGDVEAATAGLEAETARAMKLKEDQSVWRLYMVIAGLSVLLFVLITTGLS